jgi:hypothetical protein
MLFTSSFIALLVARSVLSESIDVTGYGVGTDNLIAGSTTPIKWTSSGVDAVVITLYQSSVLKDPSWPITSSTSSDGSFTWTSPSDIPTGSKYYIYICSTVSGWISTTCSKGDYFSIIGPTIKVTGSGVGSSLITTGSQVTIEWTSSGYDYVKITLYQAVSHGIDPGWLVTFKTSSDGSYYWTVPSDIPTGDNYYIYICDHYWCSSYNDQGVSFSIDGVNIDSDILNCGSVGESCMGPIRGDVSCISGKCVPTCDPGYNSYSYKAIACFEHDLTLKSHVSISIPKVKSYSNVVMKMIAPGSDAEDLALDFKMDESTLLFNTYVGSIPSDSPPLSGSIQFTNCQPYDVDVILDITNKNFWKTVYFNIEREDFQTERSLLCGQEEAISDALIASKLSVSVYSIEKDQYPYELGKPYNHVYKKICKPFELREIKTQFFPGFSFPYLWTNGINYHTVEDSEYHFTYWWSKEVSIITFEGVLISFTYIKALRIFRI